MAKKRGLGKGLGALIPPTPSSQPVSPALQSGKIEIAIDQITPNPHQPRQQMDEEQLRELADSILEHGLIQPLVVTQTGTGYQLIAGERRWRASQLAGLTTVPAIIKETSPQQMLELALVENIQRADLNPLEEAAAYAQLMADFGLTQEAVAERVGKSRSAIANRVRLLELPDKLKESLAAAEISEGHARALLSLEEPSDQIEALEMIVTQSLNVRQSEALVRRLLARESQPKKPKRQQLSPQEKSMLTRFESKLGTKVDLHHTSAEAGKITIHFYSQEELQAIFSTILGDDAHL